MQNLQPHPLQGTDYDDDARQSRDAWERETNPEYLGEYAWPAPPPELSEVDEMDGDALE